MKEDNIKVISHEIRLRTEEVDEILGHPPNWIIRWGITIVFIIIILSITASIIFKYPEIINSTIEITTENPPAVLVAKVNAKIEKFYIKDMQTVNKADIVALLESSTDYNDFFLLKQFLKDFSFNQKISVQKLPDKELRLGDLQAVYASFLTCIKNYRQFYELQYHQSKISSLNQQKQKYEKLLSQITSQTELKKEELELRKKQFLRDSLLLEKNYSHAAECEQTQSVFIQTKREYEEKLSDITNVTINISKIEQEILGLNLDYTQQNELLGNSLSESNNRLIGAMDEWEKSYLLVAPIAGKVSCTKFWSKEQNVKAGEQVITITPSKAGKIIGKLQLPMYGSGRVKKGQKVFIKFANYPHTHFGIIKGIVKQISLVPEQDYYFLEVSLPNGLKTNYNKELKFTYGMKGTAEIITEDLRLIEKLYEPLKSILRKNME